MVDPTAAQLKIRDFDELGMLIVAPAGCGKTESLALRVAGQLRRKDVAQPRRVLVATFSNRAKDNIKERLASYLSPVAMRDRVTVTNFHGLSARIVRAHAAAVGVDPTWDLPESDWVLEQCRSLALSFDTASEVREVIRLVKQKPLTDEEVAKELLASANPHAIEIEALRLAEKRFTYDDLPRIAELILRNETIVELYRNHFAAVIVDEFQDLTPQQLRIINRIGHGRTTYAGDLAQGIYGFAGASPNAVHAEIEKECGEKVVIAESHRSSPAVLSMVNSLAYRTGGTKLTSVDPAKWPSGGLAGQIGFDSTEDEAEWVLGFTRTILWSAPGHRVGVISRTGPRRRFIDAAFAASGIVHHRWDDGALDTDTARTVKGMLAVLDPAEYRSATDPLGVLRAVAGLHEIQDPTARENLADALLWCDELLATGETPAAIRSRIRVGDDATLLTMPGAHLLTGHIGKGQQFDWVVVIGAEDGCIPDFRAEDDEEIEEEARVLGVMLSRARHGAIASHSRHVEAATTGIAYAKSPSRFLADLAGSELGRDHAGIESWLQDVDWSKVSET